MPTTAQINKQILKGLTSGEVLAALVRPELKSVSKWSLKYGFYPQEFYNWASGRVSPRIEAALVQSLGWDVETIRRVLRRK